MTSELLRIAFLLWLVELPVAAVNWFVLAQRVYRPRVGELRAHQLAMVTRMVWIVGLAYLLLRLAGSWTTAATLLAGLFWVLLWLVFEWFGSLLVRRPVQEILVGWHVSRGYLWPAVLVVYLLSPLVVGLLMRG